jgi:hypothetical protein
MSCAMAGVSSATKANTVSGSLGIKFSLNNFAT